MLQTELQDFKFWNESKLEILAVSNFLLLFPLHFNLYLFIIATQYTAIKSNKKFN